MGEFQPFKHYHKDAIDKAVRLGDEKFGKLEFLAAFQSFRNQTFKPTIRHALKSTGLEPFNPDIVLDKIREKQAQRAQTAIRTPSPPPLPLNQRTPQGPASVIKYGQKLQRAYAKLKPGEKNRLRTNTTIYSRIHRFRSYTRVDRFGFESNTGGHNRSGKTS